MSATRHDDGSYSINAAELSRVFQTNPNNGFEWIDAEPHENPIRTTLLEAEISALKEARDRDREVIADLREDRDAWKKQATALLSAPQKNRRWWPWGE